MKLRRETVQKFWCPACKAPLGQMCVIEGTGELRTTLHVVRIQKAERLISDTLRWKDGAGAS